MAKRMDFKPDPPAGNWLSKLYVTPAQRKRLLKWTLYTLVFLVVLVLQDVILSRVSLPGGRTDLVPMTLLLICVMEGAADGSVFLLVCSTVYLFSGSAPGTYVIALLTFLGIGAAWLRQSYLRRSLSSTWLCAGLGMLCYELALLGLGLLLGLTHPGRLHVFLYTALWSAAAVPVLHPILRAIGSIGGESWKE